MRLNMSKIHLYKILKENKVNLVYLPLIIYWIFILVFTSIPTVPFQGIFAFEDKVEHLFAYFVLTVMLALALHFQQKFLIISRNFLIFALLIGLFYGAFDEIHQYFIPGRSCELLDWVADSVGSFLGIGVVYFFLKDI